MTALVLLLPATAAAQSNISISLIGCDTEPQDLAVRLGLELGDEVAVDDQNASTRVTVGCGADYATIELIIAGSETYSRTVPVAGVAEDSEARLLTMAIVELRDSIPADVGIMDEPALAPRRTLPTPVFPPDAPPPRRSWNAGAGVLTDTAPFVASPMIVAGINWRSRGLLGVAGSASFGLPQADAGIGTIRAFTFSTMGALSLGRPGRLEGWVVELGARATFARIDGLSSEANVVSQSASDLSVGPLLAGAWRFDVLPRFAIIPRVELGYTLSGADVSADNEVYWSNNGLYGTATVGAGVYF